MTIYFDAGDGDEEVTWLYAAGVSADAADFDIVDVMRRGGKRSQQMVQLNLALSFSHKLIAPVWEEYSVIGIVVAERPLV